MLIYTTKYPCLFFSFGGLSLLRGTDVPSMAGLCCSPKSHIPPESISLHPSEPVAFHPQFQNGFFF